MGFKKSHALEQGHPGYSVRKGKKMGGQNRIRYLLGIILVLLAFAFSNPIGEAAELKKVRVAGAVGLEITPLIVAQEMGFYRGMGLDIEIVDLPSPRDQLPALASGQIDVLMAGNTAGFINMAVGGFGSRIVCGYSHSSPKWYGSHINGILVRKDLYDKGEIKTIKDLKDRRVAFNAMIRTQTFDAALRSVGLRLEDVKIVEIAKFSDAIAALKSGGVDAAFFIQPFGVRAVKEGFAEYLLDYSALPFKIQFTMLFFSENLMKGDRQKGVDFLAATLKGIREYLRAAKGKGERAKILDAASRFTNMPKDLLETFTWSYVDPNGIIFLDSLEMQQDWYLERKYIKEKIDYRKVMDLTLLEEALKKIGRVDAQTLVLK
ncbi:MAG TPA: ABC transporter substrate-binding protein [Thermodesulfobacteriota bacterium]|nr:ABC transporter substrate-binding protein [Thermodesulfobacteriota bacterium]